jgi:hypothetical protein
VDYDPNTWRVRVMKGFNDQLSYVLVVVYCNHGRSIELLRESLSRYVYCVPVRLGLIITYVRAAHQLRTLVSNPTTGLVAFGVLVG